MYISRLSKLLFRPKVLSQKLLIPTRLLLAANPQRHFVKNPIDLEKRKKDKMDQAFRDDIKYFLSKEKFTLHDFHDKVKQGLNGMALLISKLKFFSSRQVYNFNNVLWRRF